MGTNTKIELKHATQDDVPTLQAISEAAMQSDIQTQFKQAASRSEGDDGTKMPLSDFISNPRMRVLKAVETGTSNILGFICWAFKGYAESDLPPKLEAAQRKAPIALDSAKHDHDDKAMRAEGDPVSLLNERSSTDFSQWMAQMMPEGSKCLYICGIAVHPDAQGKGVGTALVQWGTQRADQDGVICWVHSSEAGYALFNKLGFVVDRAYHVDLNEYARMSGKPEVCGREWPTYTLRYMIRQPDLVIRPTTVSPTLPCLNPGGEVQ